MNQQHAPWTTAREAASLNALSAAAHGRKPAIRTGFLARIWAWLFGWI